MNSQLHSQSQEHSFPFYIGEVVHLTAGGPAMTVAETSRTNRIPCWWFTTDGRLMREDLLANALVRINLDQEASKPPVNEAATKPRFDQLADWVPQVLRELIDQLKADNSIDLDWSLDKMSDYATSAAIQYWKLSVQGSSLDLEACFCYQSIRIMTLLTTKTGADGPESLSFILEVRSYWELKQASKVIAK